MLKIVVSAPGAANSKHFEISYIALNCAFSILSLSKIAFAVYIW